MLHDLNISNMIIVRPTTIATTIIVRLTDEGPTVGHSINSGVRADTKCSMRYQIITTTDYPGTYQRRLVDFDRKAEQRGK